METADIVISGTTQAMFCLSAEKSRRPALNLAATYNSFYGQKILLEKNRERISRNAKIVLTIEYPIYLCDHDKATTVHDTPKNIVRDYEHDMSCNLYDNVLSDKEISERINKLIQGWEKATDPYLIKEFNNEPDVEGRESRLKRSMTIQQGIIDLCRINAWEPVIVGLPYCEELYTQVSDDFVRECFLKCANMLSEKNGIPFLDYSKDEEFESIQNYLDIWYLNLFGRTRFTNRLINDLRIMEGDI